jgi:hypothetical protein
LVDDRSNHPLAMLSFPAIQVVLGSPGMSDPRERNRYAIFVLRILQKTNASSLGK